MSIRVTNPDIRFGRHGLGVGSTRDEVEQVDWGAWPMRFQGEFWLYTNTFVVTTGFNPPSTLRPRNKASLWFHFDENDIVVEISMSAGVPW